jgi:aminoglycoside phosphotransferase (APT) family kinase protein
MIEDCLPEELRGATITRIAAGLSGAGVYRVESGGQTFVLKVADEREPEADWRHALVVQRLAAAAGLAPRVVHADDARRAVLSAFVADHSFVSIYRDPRTAQAALALLGRTVRRIHALPIPVEAPRRDGREFLVQLLGTLEGFSLPDFARAAIDRVLAETPPPSERAPVLSHNDLNPSNLVYDGERILLLDWAAAGPNDPFYDLATLSVFLRMEEGTCLRVLAAYDGNSALGLPERLRYFRRLVAALAGTANLHLARHLKHPGATAADTRDSALALGEFYQRLTAGALKLGTPEGQWAFGLSLIKESLAL